MCYYWYIHTYIHTLCLVCFPNVSSSCTVEVFLQGFRQGTTEGGGIYLSLIHFQNTILYTQDTHLPKHKPLCNI